MVAGAQAHQFFRDVAKDDAVWTVGTPKGPVTIESHGNQVMPLFSSRSRAQKIIDTVPGYSKLVVLGMAWTEFERLWSDLLTEQGILLGLNWSGPRANGLEFPAGAVFDSVRATKEQRPNTSLERTREG